MPVRDGAAYLAASIDSVLGQDFENFELVVVDDGSTDATADILHRYAARDSRVVILRQEREGLVAALNRGLAAAKAPLIARLDADDIALPVRLALQFEAMRNDSALGLLGGQAATIDETGRVIGRLTSPTRPEEIIASLQRGNQMIHSTVMFRRPLVAELGGFRKAFEAAEDFDLWLRISERAKIANLPDDLVHYRVHVKNVSVRLSSRSQYSVRLAKLSAALRRAGSPDLADSLPAPPDWRRPPPDAFYAQNARDFSYLEFANPTLAGSLDLDHLDPGSLEGLPERLDFGERKLAQRALLNILDRGDRPRGLDSRKLWMTYFRLHPFRAVKTLLRGCRLPRGRVKGDKFAS
jgi:glycosyltransferase involved in cell wall biosynthesis